MYMINFEQGRKNVLDGLALELESYFKYYGFHVWKCGVALVLCQKTGEKYLPNSSATACKYGFKTRKIGF